MEWMHAYDDFNIYDEDLNTKLKNFVLQEFKKGCDNEEDMLKKLCEKFFYIRKEEIIKRLDENS